MTEVSIPVHPLSLRVLQSEYGPGHILMSNHDPLFTLLTCSPLRCRMQHASDRFSESASFSVNEALALHIQSHDWQIGAALFKHHKMELCKFAAAAVMLGFKGGAKAAIYVWLTERGVAEDDYSLETAYKLWQRFGWKIVSGKSTTFLNQIRGKAAGFLINKRGRVPKPNRTILRRTYTLSEIEIELAAHRFSKAVEQCFSRPPKKLAGQARIYYYITHTNLTQREVAQRLGISQPSVSHSYKSIRMKVDKNVTLQRMLAAALPDTAHPPAPSVHDTRLTRHRAQVRQDTRLTQAPGADRSERSCVAA